MKYLVLECGLGYAIVLDEDGRFLRVPNLGYAVGKTVENVILFPEEAPKQKTFFQRNLSRLIAVAACLCLMVIGSHQFLFHTYGTVRMQINPDVLLSVNRLNYVTGIDGLNVDGEDLIENYRSFGKKVEVVSDELSALAMEKGYLTEDGQILFTVESEHEDWKRATEELLITKISVNLPETIQIEIAHPKTEITIPIYHDNVDDAKRFDDDFEDDNMEWDDEDSKDDSANDDDDDRDDLYDDDDDDDRDDLYDDDDNDDDDD